MLKEKKMKTCENCRHCNDNTTQNFIWGFSILGFPFHGFPFYEKECNNYNSPKFRREVDDDDTCDEFEL